MFWQRWEIDKKMQNWNCVNLAINFLCRFTDRNKGETKREIVLSWCRSSYYLLVCPCPLTAIPYSIVYSSSSSSVWSSSLIVFRSSSRLTQVFKTSPLDRPPNVQLWKPLYPSRDWKWNRQCDWSLMLVKPQKPCALVSPPSLGPWPWDDDDGVMVKPLLPPMLTCQLMRLDRFSTTRRYSVRVGGPYL